MKKSFAIIVIVIIILINFYMLWYIANNQKPKNIEMNKLDEIIVLGLDSTSSNLFSTCNPCIILYFNTECGFCSDEIYKIYENIDRFENFDILIISSEPLVKITDFSSNFDTARLHFFSDNTGKLKKELNVKSYPSIFIFSKDIELIKQYKGFVPIEKLISDFANE